MPTSAHESLDVQHDEPGHRYVLRHSGEIIGHLDYVPRDGVLDIVHTRIFPQMRGRGLGAVLVRDALEDMQRGGHRVLPTCWFVAEFVQAHDEFAAMVA